MSPSFSRAKQIAVATLPQIDHSKYSFEVIENPSGRGLLVYGLAYSKNPDDVVVPSKTKGIPKGATPGLLWATNLISPTTLETYVYESLLYHTPIFVGAPDHTIWKVDGARISKVRSGR